MRYPNEDLWKVAIVFTVGAIILLLFMTLILSPSSHIVYVGESNIFNKSFKQPFEILYLVFYNGDCLSFSTHEENTVSIHAVYVKEYLDGKKRKLEDVAIICHNHFGAPYFSGGDSLFEKKLRGFGFKGSYCIYITSSRKVVCNK